MKLAAIQGFRTVKGKKWKLKLQDFPEPYRTIYKLMQKQGYVLVKP